MEYFWSSEKLRKLHEMPNFNLFYLIGQMDIFLILLFVKNKQYMKFTYFLHNFYEDAIKKLSNCYLFGRLNILDLFQLFYKMNYVLIFKINN